VVTLYPADGSEIALPRMSKLDVAGRILDHVLELRRARGAERDAARNADTAAARGAHVAPASNVRR
jgi:hypothetical protein